MRLLPIICTPSSTVCKLIPEVNTQFLLPFKLSLLPTKKLLLPLALFCPNDHIAFLIHRLLDFGQTLHNNFGFALKLFFDDDAVEIASGSGAAETELGFVIVFFEDSFSLPETACSEVAHFQ